jgi:hypothetical protein
LVPYTASSAALATPPSVRLIAVLIQYLEHTDYFMQVPFQSIEFFFPRLRRGDVFFTRVDIQVHEHSSSANCDKLMSLKDLHGVLQNTSGNFEPAAPVSREGDADRAACYSGRSQLSRQFMRT